MIRPLRRYHLWTWVAAAAVLMAAFVSSLALRRETTPVNPGLHWSDVP